MIRAVALCTLLTACPAVALELPQGARLLSERVSPFDSYALPRAAFVGDGVPAQIFEGQVERRTWRMEGGPFAPLQLLAPLRDQLAARGYEILFECRAQGCGGFDFRFGTEIAPAPHMHVDIGNFRFLSAIRKGDEALSLLVSSTGRSSYIQEIHVVPVAPAAEGAVQDALQPPVAGLVPDEALPGASALGNAVSDALLSRGHILLGDLDFGTGANALGPPGSYDTLAGIAAFLAANPSYRIVLVGHTDSVGGLAANITLSKRRAETVRDRLVSAYAVAPDRVEAEGVGYLGPIASNLTAEGREKNRRVEAMVLPLK
ncbi:OmpA family protein [Antarcticimicrobium sediminis]|uniref:OmpA family protein n=1 Tax=Antarcticimicrobium sediminis TaxID=2546227 RepID=A0A4R5EVI7_9RHOB|nr:OmpA family protein [Antarcticimicrobium sediminis]TDE38988.1 OmpA family protein [Antarcticimicrobium sediminis]